MKSLFLSLLIAFPISAKSPLPNLSLPIDQSTISGIGPLQKGEWFTKLWDTKRQQWHANIAKDQGAVVFLGDSITQGWGAKLQKSFPGLKVANRGISGDTSRGVLFRLPGDVLAVQPSAVVLLIGTNDLALGASAETIVENVEAITSSFKGSKTPMILCRVFPSSASKNRPPEKIQALNELYQKLASENSQISLLDTFTLFADADGNAPKAEFPDLLHLNDAGYAKWAAALRPIIARHGLLETEPAPFQPDLGFTSLFNGKDLSGWCFREKKTKKMKDTFDQKTSSPDDRYLALNERLIVTIPPEGRRVQQIWTSADFPNDFTLKLQFRASTNADSGIFLRGKQLQCRDFPLAGPYKELKNYKALEWNDVIITVKGRTAHCTCNGEVLEDALQIPANGPIGLEGDRGQMEYRHIQIKHAGE
ncbi:GDSL-type esterase/lipase family protein [bacterium]|nr:GDSL-type esterase/lipase family protein [Akkermansiaceae bacterium]MDA8980939.1 GDSL-type esterase/lipase family protein [bacterium]MDB4505492.1 GDSL-type esterase/lipase family protein [bacterium]MDB4578676.1 GDSL-type esterase/lipase family protein [Akkermansiaceae bacterium]